MKHLNHLLFTGLLTMLLPLSALSGVDIWSGNTPLATGLGNRVINALAVSPDGQTVYAGTGSGTVLNYVYGDSVPVAFSFTDQMDVGLSSTRVSSPITVLGINKPTTISITGGEYQINGSVDWFGTSKLVALNDIVLVRHTASSIDSTTVNTVLTIGTVSDTFSSTTAAKASQTIGSVSFSPATLIVGGTTTVSATATSGLTVTFTSNTPSVCSVSGATVSSLATGTCTIAANQSGNNNYYPAAQVTQTLAISNKASQYLGFGAAPTLVVGGTGTVAVSATTDLTVTLSSITPVVCAINGYTVTALTAGTCIIAANQAGNASYFAAAQVTINITVSQLSGFTLNVAQGWNLLGNSLNQPMSVATVFADPMIVTTVWKWDVTASGWQFYAPSMDATSLQAYTKSKGYGLLSAINPGEGYWVNAKTAGSLGAQPGSLFSLTAKNLMLGWNLVATGDDVSPSFLNSSLSDIPPSAGTTPLNLTTLWAWNNPLSRWYFYSPLLDSNGGLANYIASKGYLDFTQQGKTLGNGTGFWVNKP